MLSLTKVWEAMLQRQYPGRYNIWTESLKDEWELIKWNVYEEKEKGFTEKRQQEPRYERVEWYEVWEKKEIQWY